MRIADFGADGFDVGVDGAVGSSAGVLPGEVHELVACEDTARVFHEGEEEVVLVAGEVEGLACAADDFAEGVVVEGGCAGRRIGGCVGIIEGVAIGAAKDGSDTGGEFAGAEGFCDVVVGTEFEADDAVDFAIACSEEQDGDGR